MKKRRIIMFFAMIMSIAVIGVGFAAWIITAPTEDDFEDGTVKVETVEVEGWSFNVYWVDDATYVKADGDTGKLSADPVMVFGTPATPDPSIKDAWLTNNTIGEENMVAYLYVEGNPVKDAKNYEITDTATVSFDVYKTVDGVKSVVDATNYNSYFTSKITVAGNETSQISAQQLINGVVVKVELLWGTPNKVNPYNYYNGLSYEENYSTAMTYLKGLYDAVNGLTFQLDLKAN